MLPEKLKDELAELRLDLEVAHQGKLRMGILITAATAAVALSGWPPGDTIQRAMFYVMAAIPCAIVGVGFVINEMVHARADRRGADEADDREFEILRQSIAHTMRAGSLAPEVVASVGSFEPTPSLPIALGAPPKPLPQYAHHRLVRRASAYGSFRSGHLGIR
jgi:hypothetical protein